MGNDFSINTFVVGYCAFWLILFGTCFFLAFRHSRREAEHEAAMRAASMPQDGVWPPPPASVSWLPDHWVWCRVCHRVSWDSEWSALDTEPSHCPYEGCDGLIEDQLDWQWLIKFVPAFPEEPIMDFVYSDDTVQEGAVPWWRRRASGDKRIA